MASPENQIMISLLITVWTWSSISIHPSFHPSPTTPQITNYVVMKELSRLSISDGLALLP
jgi:hypothetical protein